MHCLVIRHLAFEDLGSFGPLLQSLGYTIDYRQAGMAPPALDEWLAANLAIVLGGPIGVYETDRYPWLSAEIELVRQRLQHGRPILGICLGAQLMAAALGAPVDAGPAKEIGWAPLALTEQGRASPLRHLADVPVLHWHGDSFALPAGATLLASTALTPHQAFALGRHALALQFHPEIDAGAIESWLIGHTLELSQAGTDLAGLRTDARRFGAALAAAGCLVLKEWLAAQPGFPPNPTTWSRP
jgi:GMP synthase (glutamine-hydrolysing)